MKLTTEYWHKTTKELHQFNKKNYQLIRKNLGPHGDQYAMESVSLVGVIANAAFAEHDGNEAVTD